MRMLCKKCGSLLAEGADKCDDCGTPIIAARDSICTNCGYVLLPGLTFCPSCGASVPPQKVEPAVA